MENCARPAPDRGITSKSTNAEVIEWLSGFLAPEQVQCVVGHWKSQAEQASPDGKLLLSYANQPRGQLCELGFHGPNTQTKVHNMIKDECNCRLSEPVRQPFGVLDNTVVKRETTKTPAKDKRLSNSNSDLNQKHYDDFQASPEHQSIFSAHLSADEVVTLPSPPENVINDTHDVSHLDSVGEYALHAYVQQEYLAPTSIFSANQVNENESFNCQAVPGMPTASLFTTSDQLPASLETLPSAAHVQAAPAQFQQDSCAAPQPTPLGQHPELTTLPQDLAPTHVHGTPAAPFLLPTSSTPAILATPVINISQAPEADSFLLPQPANDMYLLSFDVVLAQQNMKYLLRTLELAELERVVALACGRIDHCVVVCKHRRRDKSTGLWMHLQRRYTRSEAHRVADNIHKVICQWEETALKWLLSVMAHDPILKESLVRYVTTQYRSYNSTVPVDSAIVQLWSVAKMPLPPDECVLGTRTIFLSDYHVKNRTSVHRRGKLAKLVEHLQEGRVKLLQSSGPGQEEERARTMAWLQNAARISATQMAVHYSIKQVFEPRFKPADPAPDALQEIGMDAAPSSKAAAAVPAPASCLLVGYTERTVAEITFVMKRRQVEGGLDSCLEEYDVPEEAREPCNLLQLLQGLDNFSEMLAQKQLQKAQDLKAKFEQLLEPLEALQIHNSLDPAPGATSLAQLNGIIEFAQENRWQVPAGMDTMLQQNLRLPLKEFQKQALAFKMQEEHSAGAGRILWVEIPVAKQPGCLPRFFAPVQPTTSPDDMEEEDEEMDECEGSNCDDISEACGSETEYEDDVSLDTQDDDMMDGDQDTASQESPEEEDESAKTAEINNDQAACMEGAEEAECSTAPAAVKEAADADDDAFVDTPALRRSKRAAARSARLALGDGAQAVPKAKRARKVKGKGKADDAAAPDAETDEVVVAEKPAAALVEFGPDLPQPVLRMFFSPILNAIVWHSSHLELSQGGAGRLNVPITRGGFNCLEMGLGKTAVALAATAMPSPLDWRCHVPWDNTLPIDADTGYSGALLHAGTLVIAPPTLLPQWENEIKKFVKKEISLRFLYQQSKFKRIFYPSQLAESDIVLTTPDVARNNLSMISNVLWSRVIVDEAHQEQGLLQMLKRVPAKARWCLTGTPVTYRVEDIGRLLDLLGMPTLPALARSPGVLAHVVCSTMVRFTGAGVINGAKNLDLPPLTETEEIVPWTAEDSERYKELLEEQQLMLAQYKASLAFKQAEKEALEKVGHMTSHIRPSEYCWQGLRVLEICAPLKQACVGGIPVRQAGDPEEMEALEYAECPPCLDVYGGGNTKYGWVFSSKTSAVVHKLLQLRQTDSTGKILIFSSYQGALNSLRNVLEPLGFNFRTIVGHMSMSQKAAAIADFESAPPTTIFLLSARVAAVGLTLTAARYVFLLEPNMNPSLEKQAIGRCYRMGQKHPVTVFRFIMQDSIEQRTREILQARQAAGRLTELESCAADVKKFSLQVAKKLIDSSTSADDLGNVAAKCSQTELERLLT